jgi:hypothetical protein
MFHTLSKKRLIPDARSCCPTNWCAKENFARQNLLLLLLLLINSPPTNKNKKSKIREATSQPSPAPFSAALSVLAS